MSISNVSVTEGTEYNSYSLAAVVATERKSCDKLVESEIVSSFPEVCSEKCAVWEK